MRHSKRQVDDEFGGHEMRQDKERLGKENMAGIRICPRQDKTRQGKMR